MSSYRIQEHPILAVKEKPSLEFSWQGQIYSALEGETIASALFANGIRIFGHHAKDNSPQGIFCANGQCAQCMVLADGHPVKSCIERIEPGMSVRPMDGLPVLPLETMPPLMSEIPLVHIPVLILGGGPAGLSAAIELGKLGIDVILIDDKHRLGGKLVLQTHRFFGSTQAVYAGTRGIDIATRLTDEVSQYPSVQIWLQSTALAVFSDQKVGILKHGSQYTLVRPDTLLVATGAREKFLAFPGNTLPGVYGAGAFQTLVNRDLVRPSVKLFIVGGGNVGLIAGYHALQAGIKVVGLVESLPEIGGYKVHRDKLARMGVPIYTSHTVLSANGAEKVESVTIAGVDQKFQLIAGTERSFECDSLLIAVGLDPVDEFHLKARDFAMKVFASGDAEEIAEASAAMISGKIRGLEIAKELGFTSQVVPDEWHRTAKILKSKPGRNLSEYHTASPRGVLPVIHCTQEIPCNPCAALCPQGLIYIDPADIRSLPTFLGDEQSCKYCMRCVAGCPGLAMTLVDYRAHPDQARVAIPYEFSRETMHKGDRVTVLDTEGTELGSAEVLTVSRIRTADRTLVVQIQAPAKIAQRIAGIRIQDPAVTRPMDQYIRHISDDTIICRCERVEAGEIRALIKQGYRDVNEIKAITRAGMGACGSKTCASLIARLFRDEGIPFNEVTVATRRPLFVEVPLGIFAGAGEVKDVSHE
jgi:sarcosine oxidase subunit alpha